MPKSVATVGDVTATAGTTMYSPATSGSWTAGSVSYTSYDNVKSGDAKVIHKAECTFSFSGSTGNTAVSGSETVTLEAGSTLLQKGASKVLVDGDSKTGTYGNKLQVSSSEKLKSD